MIPIVFTGDNRVGARSAFDLSIKTLENRGFSTISFTSDQLSSPDELQRQINTSSLFGSNYAYALSYISECNKSTQKQLIRLAKQLSKVRTPVLFFEPDTSSGFLKEARKSLWKIVECKLKSRADFRKEIDKFITSLGRSTKTQGASQSLADQLGEESFRLTTEAGKLSKYPREVTAEVIMDLVPPAKENKVWRLVDLLFAQRRREAGTLARRLLASGEQPLLLMHLLYQQYRKLYLFAALKSENPRSSKSVLVAGANIPPFAYERFASAASKIGLTEISRLLLSFAQLEYDIKTGILTPEAGLAMFMASASYGTGS